MSVITKKISNNSTVSGYKIERVLFEECASQEQENVSNQRGEKL
jgi:flagellar basal body rod protein FlgG